MIIGIDATNLVSGGGLTHLIEFLQNSSPEKHNFQKLIVWTRRNMVINLPHLDWIEYRTNRFVSGSIILRVFWLKLKFDKEIKTSNVDLLFVPGGTIYNSFKPVVTMSRNMLPFEKKEMRRYGISKMRLRVLLLHFSQLKSFRKATGLIFLSEYAHNSISRLIKNKSHTKLIPHGLNEDFLSLIKTQEEYNFNTPIKLLYISTIDVYKHQKEVVKAVSMLNKNGFKITFDIIGGSYKPEETELKKTISEENAESYVNILGEIKYSNLPEEYQSRDIFVYASSCENLPNILIEAMASGLPIACSNKGPMPEVLKDGGVYFNPEDCFSIYNALKKLITSPNIRNEICIKSRKYAESYSWSKCTTETFNFLHHVKNKSLDHNK